MLTTGDDFGAGDEKLSVPPFDTVKRTRMKLE
jgi:hypothetical protein